MKRSQDLKRAPGSPIVPEDAKSEERAARLVILANPPEEFPPRPDFADIDKVLQPYTFKDAERVRQLSQWAATVIQKKEELDKYVQALKDETRYVEK